MRAIQDQPLRTNLVALSYVAAEAWKIIVLVIVKKAHAVEARNEVVVSNVDDVDDERRDKGRISAAFVVKEEMKEEIA